MAAIYQADIWCTECANLIRERLRSEGKAPEDENDNYSYDSDDFPKWAGDDEESDSPTHCGSHEDCVNAEILPSGRKIGCLMGSLTEDGVNYVRESHMERPSEVTEFWVNYFSLQGYDFDLPDGERCDGCDEYVEECECDEEEPI